ncbi:MAG: ammonia-forming cytochrome c nitrite reductase subunit c552 [Ignavibacteriales bacterium]|nr:ammonia-forming cytochrome c nitrite reductase subunit c552 [Ignavibacteriales bacterium]
MKKLLLSIFVFFMGATVLLAQNPRAYIQITPVSPGVKAAYGLSTSAMNASGLRVVPKGSYAYFMPGNSVSSGNADSLVVRSANWELVSKPSGSTASLIAFNTLGTKFLADMTGEYQVKVSVTTYRGTDDTTISVYSSTYLGVGGFQGVAGTGLNCKMCHAGGNNFGGVDYITNWSTSMHATALMRKMNGSEAPTFANRCISCHATGYDTNATANNNGFDDIAKAANYTFWGPGTPAKWDSLKNQYPGLVNHATIGCESCHGAGSEHAMSGSKAKIQISAQDGACAICHDAPTKHYKFSQYENSTHAVAVYEGSATRTMATTTLQDCMRCHDGRGFVAFSKGKTITTPVAPTIADHTTINCATCHDPHGNARPYNLRGTPASADTLGDGTAYPANISEEAKTCANCHKARRGAEVYGITKPTSSTWGPHHSSQLDVLYGRNAAEFTAGYTYQSGMHSTVAAKQCITCHMAPTDTSSANKHKVGGHTFKLRNPENNFQAVDSACASCHGHKASFDDFIASTDYDKNGVKEAVSKEIAGLLKQVRYHLPPKGWKDVVDVKQFVGADSILYRKAYWNHQLIVEDQSNGIHNSKFAADVLTKTIEALGGVVGNGKDVPPIADFTLNQNYPNPFNPSTKITFIANQSGTVKIRIYNSLGSLVKEVYNNYVAAGPYSVNWDGTDSRGLKVASGVYIYKLESPKFNAAKKMLLMK